MPISQTQVGRLILDDIAEIANTSFVPDDVVYVRSKLLWYEAESSSDIPDGVNLLQTADSGIVLRKTDEFTSASLESKYEARVTEVPKSIEDFLTTTTVVTYNDDNNTVKTITDLNSAVTEVIWTSDDLPSLKKVVTDVNSNLTTVDYIIL